VNTSPEPSSRNAHWASIIGARTRFLNESHPVNTSYKQAFRSALAISGFVALFLMAFQPFGLHNIDEHRLLLIASFGLPCFPPILMFNLGMAYIFRNTTLGERWKVRHAMCAIICVLLLVGMSNYFHSLIIFDHIFSWSGLLNMEFYTALVGFFPSSGVLAWSNIHLIKKYQALALSLNQSIDNTAESKVDRSTQVLALRAENQSETYEFEAEQLCYLKAEGNYVELTLCQDDAEPETRLLRLTLKDAQAQLVEQGCDVLRCHRSYLVNKSHIASAIGNAQGLVLYLDRDTLRVPVSRSYVPLFRLDNTVTT